MEAQSAAVGPAKPRLLDVLGPGLITGASDDDPSGIATYSQAGAQFGFAVSWTLLFSYPLMVAIQEISARIGRTTGRGIAANLRRHYPSRLALTVIPLLFAANTVNLGADLGAMAEALSLLVGGPHLAYVVVLGGISLVAQVFLKYTRYVSVLKWLALSLLAYFGTVLVVKVPWLEALRGLLVPTFSSDRSFWTMVVALLGTTISPYLFFWQAAQEVEDTKVKPTRQPLVEAPRQARRALERIRLDTLVGMGFSNLVALAIMITTATTLHRHGVTDIQTSAQAAQALEPVAGRLAFTIFTLGVLGTGFLGIPVLAGSAAYALGEFRRWPVGLERRPVEAKAFYLTLSAATALGALINFSPVSPISALFWSAVINGVLAAPIMALVMLMAGNRDVMGRFTIRGRLRIIGWVATVVMGIASAGFFVTLVL